MSLNLPQTDVARMLNLSYQQLNKYERGINRISAGKLYDIANTLQVSVSYFYEGFGEPVESFDTSRERLHHIVAGSLFDIKTPRVKNALYNLIRVLSNSRDSL